MCRIASSPNYTRTKRTHPKPMPNLCPPSQRLLLLPCSPRLPNHLPQVPMHITRQPWPYDRLPVATSTRSQRLGARAPLELYARLGTTRLNLLLEETARGRREEGLSYRRDNDGIKPDPRPNFDTVREAENKEGRCGEGEGELCHQEGGDVIVTLLRCGLLGGGIDEEGAEITAAVLGKCQYAWHEFSQALSQTQEER